METLIVKTSSEKKQCPNQRRMVYPRHHHYRLVFRLIGWEQPNTSERACIENDIDMQHVWSKVLDGAAAIHRSSIYFESRLFSPHFEVLPREGSFVFELFLSRILFSVYDWGLKIISFVSLLLLDSTLDTQSSRPFRNWAPSFLEGFIQVQHRAGFCLI